MIRTTLHTYSFDTNTAGGKADWKAFKAARSSGPRLHGPVLSNCYFGMLDMDGAEVELSTNHVFDNQWNTLSGRRVFDWALESEHPCHAPRGVKRGHYLVQTDEMRAIRRDTYACGYCGHRSPAPKTFCEECLGSPYLREEDLYLLRMRSLDRSESRAPLSKEEEDFLLPAYRYAQTRRRVIETDELRRKIAAERDEMIARAHEEHDGFRWLLDHGVGTENCIYYSHVRTFSFGWRSPVSPEVKREIQHLLATFPFKYEVKTHD